jgi:hypothetical protein
MLSRASVLFWAHHGTELETGSGDVLAPGPVISQAQSLALIMLTLPYIAPGEVDAQIEHSGLERQAQRLIQEAAAEPSLGNVQALLLLSMLAWQNDCRQLGRNYLGRFHLLFSSSCTLNTVIPLLAQAVAGAFSLALQEAVQTDRNESHDRSCTWHSLSIMDILLSVTLQQPPLLSDSFQVPTAPSKGADEWELWKPEPAADLIATYEAHVISEDKKRAAPASYPARTLSLFNTKVRICQAMRRVYKARIFPDTGLHKSDVLSTIEELAPPTESLEAWIRRMPQHGLDCYILWVHLNILYYGPRCGKSPCSDHQAK